MARKPAKQPATQDDAKTVVETARRTEIDGRKFYLEAAAKTANPLAKRMFESLAEAEEQHLKFIESLAAGALQFTPYAKGDLPGRLGNVFADLPESVRAAAAASPGDTEALKLGIEME